MVCGLMEILSTPCFFNISNCIDNNVKKIIVNACDKKSCLEVLELVKKYDIVYGALGFHPTEIRGYSDDEYNWLESHLTDDKVVALGEIGYDFYHDDTTKEEQEVAFIKQINLAIKYNKPLSIKVFAVFIQASKLADSDRLVSILKSLK